MIACRCKTLLFKTNMQGVLSAVSSTVLLICIHMSWNINLHYRTVLSHSVNSGIGR